MDKIFTKPSAQDGQPVRSSELDSRAEYPACLPQATRAPAWWYEIYHQGHHDLSIYDIEWAWEAYLRLKPKDEAAIK